MKVNSKLMGFDAGTKVLMADGSEKLIENIQTGDLVMSFDQLDAFGVLEPKRVLDTFMRMDKNPLHVKVENSDVELTVAPGQLFISPGSDWKDAININEIIDKSGTVHSFSVSQITRGKFQMYDIIVEDNHSLIANGVRVHNMTFSQEDVAAGRDQADSGAANNYYRRDHTQSNKHYNSGKNKKKKSTKRKDYRPEPKIDGVVSGSKIMSSTADLIDVLDEIITVTTPPNLTALKGSIQSSIDTIVNYLATFYGAIYSSSMADYDRQEILTLSLIMTSAAVDMRNPFEEASVTASGKTQAISQLTVLKLVVVKINNTLETYVSATDEDRGYFDIDVNGQKVPRSNRGSAGRNANGKYNTARQEGGARNDFGSNRGRGGNKIGSGPNQTRTTGGGNAPGGGPAQKVRDTRGQSSRAPTPTARPDKQGPNRPASGAGMSYTGSGGTGSSNAHGGLNANSPGQSRSSMSGNPASERAAGTRAQTNRNVASAANSGSFTTSGALGHNAKTTTSSKTSTGSKSPRGTERF
jgi:hypothetical protein